MKKLIALLLAVVMCLSLCACGSNAEKDASSTGASTNSQSAGGGESNSQAAIVGEWKAVSTDASIVFNEDGTGMLNYGSKQDFTWKFDEDLACYMIAASQTYNTSIQTEDGIESITLSIMYRDIAFYRPEDYNTALELLLQNRRASIAEFTNGIKKLELGTAYDSGDGMSVVFTDISYDGSTLLFYADFSNNRTTESYASEFHYTGKYYLVSGGREVWSGTYGMGFREIGSDMGLNLAPSETKAGVGSIDLDDEIQNTLDAYGVLIGAFQFEIYGTTYYIDLSEYIQ